jgi:hypothetical protein
MKKHLLIIISLILVGSISFAQSQESKIQALFVLKFVENVSWPQDRKDIVIGVIGKSDIQAELEARLKAKNPNGIVIKKIAAGESNTCDAIYVPASENNALTTITTSIGARSILVISESDLSRKGSGISFIEEAGRIHFIINKNSIESKGLRVSTSLLTLGKQA